MDFMIIIKWLTNWEGQESYAPSVITTMIDMFLNMGKPSIPSDLPLFNNWEEQTEIELLLLSIVGICVPLMLLVKPIFLCLFSGKKHKKHSAGHKDDEFK
mgnify:CR=1 FL=1|jgi:hypothetical protein